jgi:hypothetical protein
VSLGDLPRPSSGRREELAGPVAVTESDCAVWVPEGWTARVDDSGAWVITR